MKHRIPLWITRSTRFAMAVAFVSLLLYGISQAPAHAGNWQFTGSYTVTLSGQMTGAPVQPIPQSNNSIDISWNGGGGIGGSATVKINVTATWQSTNGDKPPANQSFLMTASAFGVAQGPYNGGESVNINDGLGNTVTTNIVTEPYAFTQATSTATDKRLTQSTSFQDTISVNLVGGGGQVGMGLKVAPDPRTLIIVAPTNMKTPVLDVNNNQTFDANGDPNFTSKPNPNPGQGDTTYSTTYLPGTDMNGNPTTLPPDFTKIDFTTDFEGGWNVKADGTPAVTYSWAPANSQATWHDNECWMGYAPQFVWTALNPFMDQPAIGSDAPALYHVGYSATDVGDGATANAQFVMTVHDPIEANYPDHTSATYTAPTFVGASVLCTSPGQTISFSSTQQFSVQAGATVSGKEVGWMAKYLNLNIGSVSIAVGVGQNIGAPKNPIVGDRYQLAYVFPLIEHKGKNDTWNTSGYTGTDPYTIDVLNGGFSWECVDIGPNQQKVN